VNLVPTTHRLARWSRVAALASIPLIGAMLVVVVWSTVAAVRAASETLVRGEAEAQEGVIRERLAEPGDEPLADILDDLIATHHAEGLRYLAVIERSGNVLATAGAPSGDDAELSAWLETARHGVPQRIGDRARVAVGYRRGAAGKLPRERQPRLVIEVEPQLAEELDATAWRLLVVGGLAALTLTILAAVLVRWSLRREESVRAIEQARHLATLGQMSAVLAHEIRNPLASLKGNAQLLAQTLPDGEKARAKADRVVDEAVRLETLSNDLLEFARAGAIHRRDVDPLLLVREAVAAVAPDRIDVSAEGAPRSWPVDEARLRQVMINLLENAVEMSESRVAVTIVREDRDLVITVRDSGPGIAPADLDHVFEPFFTKRTRGTGLGLAVARRLIDLHGGAIAASNAAGGGAVFTITLPRG
jgi:two-component system, NtrC family, sensor histidine kinase HydH